MHRYYVHMNVTLSIEDDVIQEASGYCISETATLESLHKLAPINAMHVTGVGELQVHGESGG